MIIFRHHLVTLPVLLTVLLAAFFTNLSQANANKNRSTDFDPGYASFSVLVNNLEVPFQVLAVAVLPDQHIPVQLHHFRSDRKKFSIRSTYPQGLTQSAPGVWSWHAPRSTGLFPLDIVEQKTGSRIRINFFVGRSAEQIRNRKLNGYTIGKYPLQPLKGLASYRNPSTFIEVTAKNLDVAVAPHFTLRQFLCKQKGGYPKYLVLDPRLLMKLEHILEKVNQSGIRTESFTIMSGYRTPAYNKAIGNVQYSRHVYGDAADIFIDAAPKDGNMDDLNKDGKIDFQDAVHLAELIEELYPQRWFKRFVGGLGRYKKTSSHPPFVHVDVRGQRARW